MKMRTVLLLWTEVQVITASSVESFVLFEIGWNEIHTRMSLPLLILLKG